MRVPARYEFVVFAFFMSGLMALIMSGALTLINLGFAGDFLARWLRADLFAWPIAFPTVLIVAPLVRRLTRLVVADNAERRTPPSNEPSLR